MKNWKPAFIAALAMCLALAAPAAQGGAWSCSARRQRYYLDDGTDLGKDWYKSGLQGLEAARPLGFGDDVMRPTPASPWAPRSASVRRATST